MLSNHLKPQKVFFFKTRSDILALPHYNFSPPDVQIVDHNPIRELFEFQWQLGKEEEIAQRKWWDNCLYCLLTAEME